MCMYKNKPTITEISFLEITWTNIWEAIICYKFSNVQNGSWLMMSTYCWSKRPPPRQNHCGQRVRKIDQNIQLFQSTILAKQIINPQYKRHS